MSGQVFGSDLSKWLIFRVGSDSFVSGEHEGEWAAVPPNAGVCDPATRFFTYWVEAVEHMRNAELMAKFGWTGPSWRDLVNNPLTEQVTQ